MTSTKKNSSNRSKKVSNNNLGSRQESGAKYWTFTIPVINYFMDSSKDLRIWTYEEIITALKNMGTEHYVFQTEAGNDSDYLHFQGTVTFKTKTRLSTIRKELPGHWEKTRSAKAIDYCSKKDTRIDGPWEEPETYHGQDLPDKEELKDWQKDYIKIIEGPVDPRAIHWIYDPVGGKGKSTFAKYIDYHYPGTMVCGGRLEDIAFAITKMKNKTSKPVMLFDIPRCHKNHLSYAALEQLKNGHFFSSKYESEKYIGFKPHILVFSNFLPDTDKLSADRWRIRELE